MHNPTAAREERQRRPRGSSTSRLARGQGLAEFALALPLLMLILLIAIDAGRLFYSYVTIQNASRIAANFAAAHADSWPGPSTDQADYAAQIGRDTAGLECPDTVPDPVFSPGGPPPRSAGDGHVATVTLQCTFHPLTPFVSTITGDIVLTGTEAFPIRSGLLAGFPLVPEVPTPTPAPTPTATPTATPGPTPTATPGPTATPTLGPSECRVPMLIGQTTTNAALAVG